MHELTYTLRLVSDAEPGTGLGGVTKDDCVPRNHKGVPILRASHLKGLMRSFLSTLEDDGHPWAQGLCDRVLGRPGRDGDGGAEAAFSLGDAALQGDEPEACHTVTRTAIDPENGTVKGAALRTTESLAAGRTFAGRLTLSAPNGSAEDLAARLALLSIDAVGSSRTRGCGRCLVGLDGETRSPGALLKALSQAAPWQRPAPQAAAPATPASGPAVFLRLVFQAEGPVCCPDVPVRGNVIRSGFAIPASAVQGALLTRLNTVDAQAASRCYAHQGFRAWPLLPCGPADEALTDLPVPCRVSLTHRVAKLAKMGHLKEDEASEQALAPDPYKWQEQQAGAPLKASDGVLLSNAEGVSLWKSGSMPRVVTAHCVLHDAQRDDGRNLFNMEAMAPLSWSGLLQVPEEAAETLLQELEKNPHIGFGRGRSVRGQGQLTATRLNGTPAELAPRNDWTVLIAQSPLLLPDTPPAGASARDELNQLAQDWAETHNLPQVEVVWTATAIRFGWNRAGLGRASTEGRLRACRTAVPGTVLRFAAQADAKALAQALAAGFGDGREQGFGALAVHPGAATELFELPRRKPPRRRSAHKGAVASMLKLHRSLQGRLPSPSQIYAVQQRLVRGGVKEATDYLNEQTKRTTRIWQRWESCVDAVADILQLPGADKALRLLADLAIAEKAAQNRKEASK